MLVFNCKLFHSVVTPESSSAKKPVRKLLVSDVLPLLCHLFRILYDERIFFSIFFYCGCCFWFLGKVFFRCYLKIEGILTPFLCFFPLSFLDWPSFKLLRSLRQKKPNKILWYGTRWAVQKNELNQKNGEKLRENSARSSYS